MILSKCLAKYSPEGTVVTYELLRNEVVDMGPRRVHSYSICKVSEHKYSKDTTKSYDWIARGIKRETAILEIWEDVKAGIQK